MMSQFVEQDLLGFYEFEHEANRPPQVSLIKKIVSSWWGREENRELKAEKWKARIWPRSW